MTGKPPDEIPWNVPAYITDTTHLSTLQHGAYMLILMAMWRHGGKLPDDDRVLANITKLPMGRWKSIMGPVRALLRPAGEGFLSQKKLNNTLGKILETSKKNSMNGKLGAAAKALKSLAATPALASGSAASGQEGAGEPPERLLTSLKDSSSRDSVKKKENKKERARSKAGDPLPEDWKPSEDEIEYGIKIGFTRQQVLSMGEAMRCWAIANAHRKEARKAGALGWSAAYKGWMRRKWDETHSGDFPRGGGGRPGENKVTPAMIARGDFRRDR